MKTHSILLAAALALCASVTTVASAQQAPAAPVAPAAGAPEHHHGMMMRRAFEGVTLTPQQKTQIQQLVTQYRQAHPAGSAPDPQARKTFQEQIMNLLTPEQQAQVKSNMEKMHAHHRHDANEVSPAPTPTP